tara:strand:- start:2974 stop:3147 length:174 start_codon:yes stop_codon:yes gene_type:complete
VPPNDSERIAPAGDISGIDERDNPNKKLILTSRKALDPDDPNGGRTGQIILTLRNRG